MKLTIKKPQPQPKPSLPIKVEKISSATVLEQPLVKKKKASRPPNTRTSNFFMTVNTNKTMFNLPDEQVLEEIRLFEEKIEVFLNKDLPEQFFDLTDSKEAPLEYDDIPLIKRFLYIYDENGKQVTPSVAYCTEIGPGNGYLHCHMTLQTRHKALNVKLSYSKINTYWHEKLGGKAHFDSKLVRDSNFTIEQYMMKQNEKYQY